MSSVAVGATVPELSGLRLVTEDNIEEIVQTFQTTSAQTLTPSDTFTDSCGVATYTLVYTCPESADREVGGDFVAFSGPLFSEAAQISVRLDDPPVIVDQGVSGVSPSPATPIVIPAPE
jgi:hypothetical protein